MNTQSSSLTAAGESLASLLEPAQCQGAGTVSEGGANAGSFETAIEQAVVDSQAKGASGQAAGGLIQALTKTQAKLAGVLEALASNESSQGVTGDSSSESVANAAPEEKKDSLLSGLPEGLACNLLLQVTPEPITLVPKAAAAEQMAPPANALPSVAQQSSVLLNAAVTPAEAAPVEIASSPDEVTNQQASTDNASARANAQNQAATLGGKLAGVEIKEAYDNAASLVIADQGEQNEAEPAKSEKGESSAGKSERAKPEAAKPELAKSETATADAGLAKTDSREVKPQSGGNKLSPLVSKEGPAVQESSSDKLPKVVTDEGSVLENKTDALPKANQNSENTLPSQTIQSTATPARKVETGSAPDYPKTQSPDPSGTSTAKSIQTMQNTAETGQTLQSLPGKGAKTASLTQSVEPAQGKTAISASGEAQGKEVSPRGEISLFVDKSAQVTNEAAKSVANGKSTASLEHVEAQIRNQVVQFQRIGADSMSVVLKPDTNLELHLQLRLEQGQVQVVAECKRGDLAALNQTWGQLQQNLAGQGIRVSALQEGSNFSQGSWTGNFQRQDWQSGEQQQSFDRDNGTSYRFFGDEAASTPHRGGDTKPYQLESKVGRAPNKSGEKRSLEWWA